jgi:hypothetical protein
MEEEGREAAKPFRVGVGGRKQGPCPESKHTMQASVYRSSMKLIKNYHLVLLRAVLPLRLQVLAQCLVTIMA